MPATTTISEAVKKCIPELEPLLAKRGQFSSVHPSPDLMDLLYWNVLVSFVVSLVSSAAYDGLKYCLNSKGRVEPADLAQLKSELNAPLVIPDGADLSAAKTRIAMLLETQYFYGEVEARETSMEAVQVIVCQVGSHA